MSRYRLAGTHTGERHSRHGPVDRRPLRIPPRCLRNDTLAPDIGVVGPQPVAQSKEAFRQAPPTGAGQVLVLVLHKNRPHAGIECRMDNIGVEALGIDQQHIGLVDPAPTRAAMRVVTGTISSVMSASI